MQAIFIRYEKKYLISRSQYETFLPRLLENMQPASPGQYLVQNLYYDTEQFDNIRVSVEKPVYKEKLRLRRYGDPGGPNPIFLELKKKFKGVVYKRRILLPCGEPPPAGVRSAVAREDSQIAREIGCFLALYPVSEKIHISYERRAFTGLEDPGLRVTFDTDIRFRLSELSFTGKTPGTSILPPEQMLMEVKTPRAIPLWLSRLLCGAGVFPRSFSKYGIWYTEFFLKSPHPPGRKEMTASA